jgi:hypothetical protein
VVAEDSSIPAAGRACTASTRFVDSAVLYAAEPSLSV